MKCTWRDCERQAKHSQEDRQGQEWANLCDEHNEELAAAIRSFNPQALLRAWARAKSEESKKRDAAEFAQRFGALMRTLKPR